ncbi:MAG: argininosuccinate synthase, partial [Gammaproteobacteria bacterium]|nr:argininosuccinate synthase [Gammaproteobacteria bacterium]
MSKDQTPIILAFSGGLDTSFCVPWLRETCDREVVTATVDTGGIDAAAASQLEERAYALGAVEHVLIDARQDFFDTVIRYLIAGNVLRGNAYPLCVGAERGLQASRLAAIANERGASTVAHGCTAAGNDQVRFEVALRTLSPGLEVLAPVRDNSWVRDEQLAYLEKHDLPLPAQGSAYSINRGLWGITIGGRETLTSQNSIPEDAWVLSAKAFSAPLEPSRHTLEFENGVPVALDDETLSP